MKNIAKIFFLMTVGLVGECKGAISNRLSSEMVRLSSSNKISHYWIVQCKNEFQSVHSCENELVKMTLNIKSEPTSRRCFFNARFYFKITQREIDYTQVFTGKKNIAAQDEGLKYFEELFSKYYFDEQSKAVESVQVSTQRPLSYGGEETAAVIFFPNYESSFRVVHHVTKAYCDSDDDEELEASPISSVSISSSTATEGSPQPSPVASNYLRKTA
jgi:hypothetical protein